MFVILNKLAAFNSNMAANTMPRMDVSAFSDFCAQATQDTALSVTAETFEYFQQQCANDPKVHHYDAGRDPEGNALLTMNQLYNEGTSSNEAHVLFDMFEEKIPALIHGRAGEAALERLEDAAVAFLVESKIAIGEWSARIYVQDYIDACGRMADSLDLWDGDEDELGDGSPAHGR